MEWLNFILFEVVVTSVFGLAGTYLVSLWKKDSSFNDLLNNYGYAIGFVGAAIFTITWILFF
jgi:hypothetical protein